MMEITIGRSTGFSEFGVGGVCTGKEVKETIPNQG